MLLEALLEQHKGILRADLENVIEQILLAVGDANECSPLLLVLRISKQEHQKALGQVFTSKKKLLYAFDAGAEIQKIFDMQMSRIPQLAKKAVLRKMGGHTVEAQVSESLEHGAILVRYGGDPIKFKYYQEVDKGMKLIDIDDFFLNITI